MKIRELSHKIAFSRGHTWRLAKAGIIPGTKRTKGGHFYFVECRKLTRWINLMGSNAFRKKELARAYQRGYGNETPEFKKLEKEHLRWLKYYQKKAAENRREFKGYTNQYEDLFQEFFYDTDDLIRILKNDFVRWRECKLKDKMRNMSRERLMILRDLIDKWLNEQTIL